MIPDRSGPGRTERDTRCTFSGQSTVHHAIQMSGVELQRQSELLEASESPARGRCAIAKLRVRVQLLVPASNREPGQDKGMITNRRSRHHARYHGVSRRGVLVSNPRMLRWQSGGL